jgi:SMODS and SLOG-associating 2TM effector domain 3/SMODS and SLOG-associating 2TM effector domain 1
MTAPVQSPPPSPPELALRRADYPALYQSASDASRHGQRWYRHLVVANLGLLVAVAALSATSSLVPDSPDPRGNAFKAVVVLVLLGAMAANFVNWRRGDDEDWFDGRAVAESVKTASWRYMMRTEPFEDDATCDQQLARRLGAILGERRGLRQELGAPSIEPHQITARMREARRLGVRKRRDFYVRARLDSQIPWYHGQARLNGRLAERWFWASFGAEFVGLAIAVSTFVFSLGVLNLAGVAAALAVAFTAWTQLGRHGELNKSYGLAWQELLAIKDLASAVNTERGLQDLVRAGEDAISREHTMWVAKRG